MSTSLPYIAVRCTPERIAKVKRIANACGMSMSQWVGSILDQAIPMSEKAMRAALMGEAAQAEFLGNLRAMAEAAGVAVDELTDEKMKD